MVTFVVFFSCDNTFSKTKTHRFFGDFRRKLIFYKITDTRSFCFSAEILVLLLFLADITKEHVHFEISPFFQRFNLSLVAENDQFY